MSNRAAIQFRQFVNLNNELNPTGETSYGVVVYDDYGNDYCNLWTKESLAEEIESSEQPFPEVLIELLLESKIGISVLDHIQEMEKGIDINGTWYDWDEIKNAF